MVLMTRSASVAFRANFPLFPMIKWFICSLCFNSENFLLSVEPSLGKGSKKKWINPLLYMCICWVVSGLQSGSIDSGWGQTQLKKKIKYTLKYVNIHNHVSCYPLKGG